MRRLIRGLPGVLAVPAFFLCYAWAQKTSTSAVSVPRSQISGPQAGMPSPDTIHVRSFLVVAPVTVTDAAGNFVEDLRREQFQVWDDGVAQRITHFGLATEPIAAVIVIQTSEEVAPVLPEVHPLGVLFSSLLLGKSGEAAVVTYADKAEAIQNFSTDPATLAKTLRSIEVSGIKARLNDALSRAIFMLSNEPNGKRRVIIVFSEGFDRGSETSGAEIVRAASNSNVTIYGIRFSPAGTEFKDDSRSALTQVLVPCSLSAGNENPSRPCNFALNLAPLTVLGLKMGSKKLRANLLGQYGGYTGGIVYTHWKKGAVQDQLQNIALAVSGQYDLAYVPTTLKRTGFHPIRVTVSDPGLHIRTRAGYFYASAQK